MSNLREKLERLKRLEAERKTLLFEIKECKELNKARVALLQDSFLKRSRKRTCQSQKSNRGSPAAPNLRFRFEPKRKHGTTCQTASHPLK